MSAKFVGKQKLLSLPLIPITSSGQFQQWSLDLIDEINPPSIGQQNWILTATDYFKKWIEVVPTMNAIDKVIMNFLWSNIFAMLGFSRNLVTNNTQAFNYRDGIMWELQHYPNKLYTVLPIGKWVG
jgi:hypothetical protein